uniref:Uncharacterized protein n=1 Tax=Panagrolaimus sp. JU765 TaxID=591449 RepID=A0AC34RJU8_9BILA
MDKSSNSVRFSPYPPRQQVKEANNATSKAEISPKAATEQQAGSQEQNDSVSPIEVGNFVANMGLSTNLELMDVLPDLTNDINAVDVVDVLTANLTSSNVKNTLVGLCVVINRLLQDNRYLMRELANVKSSSYPNSLSRLERYEFRKRFIRRHYSFSGCEGIPSAELHDLLDKFDQTTLRRGENALATIRRFVRFILESVIPQENHTKFTVRERGGQDHLTELPNELLILMRDMCLEALSLLDARTEEERVRREDFSDFITRAIKNALQEMRRNPRKPKTSKRSESETG